MAVSTILKGGLVLLFATQVHAEQIPFDYFFGKIVGKRHLGALYTNGRAKDAQINFSVAGGWQNKFAFYYPGVFTWRPTNDLDKWQWNRSPLSGDFRVSKSLRLRDDYTDIYVYANDNSDIYGNDDSDFYRYDVSDRKGFRQKESLMYLKSGGVEYKENKALYNYLSGMSINRDDVLIKGSALVSIDRTRRDYYDSFYGSRYAVTSEGKNDTLDLRFEGRYGVTDRLEVGLVASGLINGTPQTWRSSEVRIDSTGATVGMGTVEQTLRHDHDNASITPSVNFLIKPNLWLKTSTVIDWHLYANSNQRVGENFIVPDAYSLISRDVRQEIKYGITLEGGSASKNPSIEYRQLMDNFKGYYGKQLERGVFLENVKIEFYLNSVNAVSLQSGYGDRATQDQEYDSPQLLLHWDGSYYFKKNLYLTGVLHLERSVTPRQFASGTSRQTRYSRHQELGAEFAVSYFNYVWEDGARQNVSWEGVSDMDYVLGPLVQPQDLRVTLNLKPPMNIYAYSSGKGKFLEFNNGQSTRVWTLDFAGAYGVYKDLEFSFTGEYLRDGTEPRSHRIIQGAPTLKWQFEDIARLNVSYSFYRNSNHDFSYPNRWALNIRLDLMI